MSKIIGITAVTIIAIVVVDKVFRYFVPKLLNEHDVNPDKFIR
jgi:hypothetical protein